MFYITFFLLKFIQKYVVMSITFIFWNFFQAGRLLHNNIEEKCELGCPYILDDFTLKKHIMNRKRMVQNKLQTEKYKRIELKQDFDTLSQLIVFCIT